MNWMDATTYSQGQRGKVAQTAWSADIGGKRIWVSCGHRDFPDAWVMRFGTVIEGPLEIGKKDKMNSDEARKNAVETAWDYVRQEIATLGSIEANLQEAM